MKTANRSVAKRKGKGAAAALRPGVIPPNKKHFSVAEAAVILDTSIWSVYRDVRLRVIEKLLRRGPIRIPRGELKRILNYDSYSEEA